MGQLFQFISAYLRSRVGNQEGQGLVEYVLIIVLVAVALIAALGLLQGGISTGFSMAVSGISSS